MNQANQLPLIRLQLHREINALELLAQSLGIPCPPDLLAPVDPALGQGFIKCYPLPNDLHLYLYDFTLHRAIQFETINPEDSGVFSIFVNLSAETIEKTIDGQRFAIEKDLPQGIFFYSPGHRIHLQYPPGKHFVLINITFTEVSLHELLGPELARQLQSRPQYLFEELSLGMEKTLRELAVLPGEKHPLEKLEKFSLLMLFLKDFFHKLNAREKNTGAQPLSPGDLARLFKAREIIHNQLAQLPGIAVLAREVGLGETRLKSYFRQVFGHSIYQYAQYARMVKARELLDTRQYNVSEVAELVGYTNLSHFGRAFRKHSGCQPKEYLLREISKS